MGNEPTPREADVLVFITNYYHEHGVPPVLDEVAKGIGIASRGTVHTHVLGLVGKGKLSARKLRGVTAYYPVGTGGFQ